MTYKIILDFRGKIWLNICSIGRDVPDGVPVHKRVSAYMHTSTEPTDEQSGART